MSCSPKIGGSLVGVWNGWGYGIAFFGSFRSLKFGENRSFCGNSGIFAAKFGL